MEDSKEKILYKGGPSQRVNLDVFLMCAILFGLSFFAAELWENVFIHKIPNSEKVYMFCSKVAMFLSIFWAARAWLRVFCQTYQITNERFIEIDGIFSRTTTGLELFRVKDITMFEPFALRVLGCGDIILDTSDKTNPVVVLHAVRNARPIMEMLRRNVDAMRTLKGVREIDA